MRELTPPDNHHLNAATGWLELGNHAEAKAELAGISDASREHPDVLEVRWEICAATQSWDAAVPISEQSVAKAPGRPQSWIHRAYALRRASSGGLQRAWDALLPAAELFPQEPWIPYNLACYAAQFSRLDEAWEWFCRSLGICADKQALKRTALADRDQAVAEGVTINGLAIINDRPNPGYAFHTQPPGGLPEWYRQNVIGGPGSFLRVIDDFRSFSDAMTNKLVSEIVARHGGSVSAHSTKGAGATLRLVLPVDRR